MFQIIIQEYKKVIENKGKAEDIFIGKLFRIFHHKRNKIDLDDNK